ncbi:MAG: TetR/AcrR family transcriptional regulator [Eubacteriaceae bacterium]
MLTNRQKQAIVTRHKLIVCAMELFKMKSYEKVTIKEICEEASVSVGAFYHYFDSKEDVIDDAFKTFDIELEEFMDSQNTDSYFIALKLITREYLIKTAKSGPSVITSIFRLQMISDSKYVINKERYFYRKLNEIIQKGIDTGEFKCKLSTEDICDWIFRTSRGVILDWCLYDGSYDLVERGCIDIDLVVKSLIGTV